MEHKNELTDEMLVAIEGELKRQVSRLDLPATHRFQEMLAYHMGWSGEKAGPEAAGKRLRPLILLLTTASCSGDWKRALPAAAAVELIHNFSLVHDDIQDNSEKRRGRPTVWKKYGAPQAINAGDALFVLGNRAALGAAGSSPERTIEAARVLHEACLDLTRGQYLDMSFEGRDKISLEEYWQMIEGKTASLLSACCQIGAILAEADKAMIGEYREFGRALGLAFQIKDDLLGIWGDEMLTGKSTASDLVEGKKTLPVVYGLSRAGKFARRWTRKAVKPEEVSEVARLLEEEGARDFVQSEAQRLTEQSMFALRRANPQGEAGSTLIELAGKLLNRDS